jgi:molybdopterin-synthase adenylyltransferase
LNDYCFQNNIPWIYGSATSSMGTVTSFIPGQTPCFRCVYGNDETEDNASCDVNGVILPALTVTASLQVTEAIKILVGTKNVLVEEIRYNVWTREESSVDIRIFEDKECLCKKETCNKTNTEKHNQAIYVLCSGNSIQVNHTYSEKEVASLLLNSDYLLHTSNPVFTEFKKGNSKRAVAFNTGKIVFHHTDRNEVEYLLKKDN